MQNPLDSLFGNVVELPFDVSNFFWIGAVGLVAIYALYSAILLYHWLRYGEGTGLIFLTMALYFGVSLVLISSLFTATAFLT